MENTRRWSGYVCPDCRFVFRIPRDHDGKGIVCPSCRRMLRVPAEGDVTPPLTVPVREVVARVDMPADEAGVDADHAEEEHAEMERKRRRSKHRKHGQEIPDWDSEEPGGRRSRAADRQRMGWMFAVGLLMFGTLVGAVVFVLNSGERAEAVIPTVLAPRIDAVPGAQDGAEDLPEMPAIMRRSEIAVLAEAEPMAERFLNAETVDEMLPLVRRPEVAEPRMRAFYPDGKVVAPGMFSFNSSGALNYKGVVASADFLTADHVPMQLAFVETDEGLKVDWESFVGWSEMPWNEFMENRVTEPKVFRVILKVVEYYNFGFSDDSFWQSYRLESPDGEQVMFGYVERGSLLQQQLRPDQAKASIAVMVSARFPENAESGNQVLIERFVADGWIEDGE